MKSFIIFVALMFSSAVFSSVEFMGEDRFNAIEQASASQYTIVVNVLDGSKIVFKVGVDGKIMDVFKVNTKVGINISETKHRAKKVNPTLKRFKSYDAMFSHFGTFNHSRIIRV